MSGYVWSAADSTSAHVYSGDLDVMEVLLPSDEVLPALAAVMAVGTPQVHSARKLFCARAPFSAEVTSSCPFAASNLVSMCSRRRFSTNTLRIRAMPGLLRRLRY